MFSLGNKGTKLISIHHILHVCYTQCRPNHSILPNMHITIFICVIILGPPQYALPNEEAVHSIFYSAAGTHETSADKPWTIYLKQVG